MAGPSSCTDAGGRAVDENGAVDDEEAPLLSITTAECRICQEEDSVDTLETPCACNGSLKYAHRKCVQHWCNEKGDITCEICHQAYQPGYTAPPPCPRLEETTIDIGGGWQISGTTMDLNDPRFLVIAEAERQLLEGEYEDYNASNENGPVFFRSAVLILMALLLLRHAVTMPESEGEGDEDESFAFYILFLLRVVGFLLPCYIMAWAISILNRRRQRQESVAMAASQMAASQIAYVLQAGQRRGGLHFAFASAPPPASAQPPAAAVTPAVAPQEDMV